MVSFGDTPQRDLAALDVVDVGCLDETGDPWKPYRLLDADGAVVEAGAEYLAELHASGRSLATLRSYGMDLLRWWRFLSAVDVRWDRATPAEGRDFALWMKLADKPTPVHWRYRNLTGSVPSGTEGGRARRPAAGAANAVTGKTSPGPKYARSTRAHAETVLRGFYDFHLEAGRGPIMNPFPLDRTRRAGRANAHHNPMDDFRNDRVGRYRPKLAKQAPRRIPDALFNELFGSLRSNRDRALLAFWVSTGARAQELLTAPPRHVDPGQQLIGVIRKGSGVLQHLPAAPDAFVWLRLYQEELRREGALQGRSAHLWLTLRRPWRPLTYPAARAMFVRAQQMLGSNWSLHDLRHTAAHRMASDPDMPLVDVQWVLGHAFLSTTQLYTAPSQEEVIAHVRAHQERRARSAQESVPPAHGYSPTSLDVLFGRRS